MLIILVQKLGLSSVVNKIYIKINFIILAKGSVPIPRAAHAACSPNENQLIIYGGATGCKFNLYNFFFLKK